MKRIALPLAAFALCASAFAQQVSISSPWVRGAVPGQQATGLFMNIEAAQDVRLIGGASPVAGVVEIHEMSMEQGVMKMRQLENGLPIAKGQPVELKPGGYHVMLMQLKQALKEGDTVPVTLTFEDGASKKQFTQQIQAPVTGLGQAHGEHDHGGHDSHGGHGSHEAHSKHH